VKQGFSEGVASQLSKARRQSTHNLYATCWATFAAWCDDKKIDAWAPSIPEVADFLLHLFQSKKLAVSTLKGYRSAIATTLAATGYTAVSSDASLHDLMRSFFIDRPVPDRTFPEWDLALVLDALRHSPFEPLGSIPLANLTYKTVFLTALASGKRRGELHAFMAKGSGVSDQKSSYVLSFDRRFLAKTQRLGHRGQTAVSIPAIPYGDRLEQALCPVRVLQAYNGRATSIRLLAKASKFFVAMKPGFSGDISANTISRWLVKAITTAYEAVGQQSDLQRMHKVRAHDVRAMAASLAFMRSVSLEDIFQATQWRCHSTFTDFYLRDLSIQSNDLLRLGPIVAAQSLVQ
jgi:hypothetical protein